jgi:uncharacterized protein
MRNELRKSAMMKRFVFDSIIDRENICNLEKEQQKIAQGVDHGLKLLVYGKRNTGKTSLVKNVIAQDWLQKHSSGFFMYVDLLGIRQTAQLSERMTVAFIEAYNRCFRMRAVFQSMLDIIKGIRPAFEMDERGELKLTFGVSTDKKIRPFGDLVKQLDAIYHAKIPVLLVLDEFQDIAFVDQAEALLRESLEAIDSEIPIIVLGSKQHLLSRIFAKPKAPFFNWGTHISFEPIEYSLYHAYMNERFEPESLSISSESARYLQDTMGRIPEAINRLCYTILVGFAGQGEITKDRVDEALTTLVSDRRAEPERYLAGFSAAEQNVITELARQEPLQQPQGKQFTQRVGLTASGVRKIIMKLEDEAVIYKETNAYILADPLLKTHIKHFRI